MAHQFNITVGGHTVPVWEFDSTAQQIDNVVAALGAPSTPQEALAALGAGVRPNLLDNAYFVGGGTGYGVFPVNQRGKTQYTELGPMFDRWKLEYGVGSIVELTPDGLTILGGTRYSLIRSSLSRTLPVGATYTLTVLFRNGTVVSNVITVPNENNRSEHTPITPGGTYMRLFGPKTFEIVGITGDKTPEIELIKLEQGNRQTAAYQKSDGTWAMLPQNLDYQRELAKCQEYYWESSIVFASNTHFNEGHLLCNVQFPVKMRTIPAVTIKSVSGTPGILSYWASMGDSPVTATANSATISDEGFNDLVTSTMQSGAAYAFRVVASAEL